MLYVPLASASWSTITQKSISSTHFAPLRDQTHLKYSTSYLFYIILPMLTPLATSWLQFTSCP